MLENVLNSLLESVSSMKNVKTMSGDFLRQIEESLSQIVGIEIFVKYKVGSDIFMQKIKNYLRELLPEFKLHEDKSFLAEIKGENIYEKIYPIELEFVENLAFRTADFLRADLRAIVLVKLDKNQKELLANIIAEEGVITPNLLFQEVRTRAEMVLANVLRKIKFQDIYPVKSDDNSETQEENQTLFDKFIGEINTKLGKMLKSIGIEVKDFTVVEFEESNFHYANTDNILDIRWYEKRREAIFAKFETEEKIEFYRESLDIVRQTEESRANYRLSTLKTQYLQQEELEHIFHEQLLEEAKGQILTLVKRAEAERQKECAQILKEAAQDEADRISTLATAEGKIVPKSVNEAIAKLIIESGPELMKALPEITQELGLKEGVFKGATIYSIPNTDHNHNLTNLGSYLSIYSIIAEVLDQFLAKSR